MAIQTFPATRWARLFAWVFALAGVAGFLPNPLIGEGAWFVTNFAHNAVHLATAFAFFLVSIWSETVAQRFTQGFGVVYFLVGVAGVFVLGDAAEAMLLGLVHINHLDNLLHLGLGVGIGLVGFFLASTNIERETVAI